MPKAVFFSPDGSRAEVEVNIGGNLMQAALANSLYAIVGDCGGSASCATCHVYVDNDYLARIPPPSPREEEMLACTASKREVGSRLSCQIVMREEIDGITVRIADQQW